MFGVRVEGIPSAIDEKVTGEVGREKNTKAQTGDGHHPLFADGRRKRLREPVHPFLPIVGVR
jgi:hypothetical protein